MGTCSTKPDKNAKKNGSSTIPDRYDILHFENVPSGNEQNNENQDYAERRYPAYAPCSVGYQHTPLDSTATRAFNSVTVKIRNAAFHKHFNINSNMVNILLKQEMKTCWHQVLIVETTPIERCDHEHEIKKTLKSSM